MFPVFAQVLQLQTSAVVHFVQALKGFVLISL